MESRVLKTSLFEHPHSAERIRIDFDAIIEEFKLKEKKNRVYN